jgi:G:T-mismatch repair DNA endonuclease (very short patch repair protein)
MKHKNCIKCKREISKNCHLGYCNRCRDRSGEKNPFYGKKHNKEMVKKTKDKLSLIIKKRWKDKNYREKVIKGISKPRREGFKKEQSDRVKIWYKNNPNQRDSRSLKMKESWKNGKIEPNINSINESKLEIEFREELKKRLVNRNVRKSTLRIGGRWFYPDARIDKNIIVEFYGNYWHANPKIFKSRDIVHHELTAEQIWKNDKKRIKILVDNGFKIFIVWQDKYQENKEKCIKELINKV